MGNSSSNQVPLMDGVMRFDELPDETPVIDSAAMTNRTPGLHLSSILKALDEHLHGKKKDSGWWNLGLSAIVGFVWEVVLELAYKKLFAIRPEELELDGVKCSPDGIGEDPFGRVPIAVHEYKCWWRSTKRTPMHDWYVVMQNACYCHVVGTTVGVFRVLYLVGDSWMDGPKYKQWRVEYSPEFLESTWAMVVRNKGLGIEEKGGE